jgi:hypothetical protein
MMLVELCRLTGRVRIEFEGSSIGAAHVCSESDRRARASRCILDGMERIELMTVF